MKRTRVFLAALLIGGFTLLNPSPVFAEQAIADVTCGKDDGTEQTFGIGWDNANQFFNGKGDIARLYCEGGFSNGYPIYVADNLPVDSPLRWYNGIAPILEPTPEPIPSVEPEPVVSVEPTLNPEPTPIPEPSQSSSPTPEPTATPTPEPTPEATQAPEPSATPTTPVEPEPTLEPTLEPEPTQEPQPQEPLEEPQAEVTVEPEPSVDPSEPPLEPTLEPTPTDEPSPEVIEEPTLEEVTQEVIDDALADGVLTDDERELVADALLEEFAGEAITFEALQEAGLDYEDLPPETPVTLENGVVLLAEVADALEIFDSGAEVLATILENPAKALKALANIGADMTTEERETAQNTVVAAVVVTQVAQVRKIK
jgi:hypothetical protein